mgnify:CR=1 FL=1
MVIKQFEIMLPAKCPYCVDSTEGKYFVLKIERNMATHVLSALTGAIFGGIIGLVCAGVTALMGLNISFGGFFGGLIGGAVGGFQSGYVSPVDTKFGFYCEKHSKTGSVDEHKLPSG